MLLKVADHICECLAHAEQARERAEATTDPQTGSDYLDIELRWMRLAESYRLVEQMERFLDDAHLRRRVKA
jgi:hypothetical protein